LGIWALAIFSLFVIDSSFGFRNSSFAYSLLAYSPNNI